MGGNYAELKMYGSESGVGYREKEEEQQQHHREEDDEFHTREASTDFRVLFRLSLLSECVCGGHEGGEHAVTAGVLYTGRFVLAFYVSGTVFTMKCMTASVATVLLIVQIGGRYPLGHPLGLNIHVLVLVEQ